VEKENQRKPNVLRAMVDIKIQCDMSSQRGEMSTYRGPARFRPLARVQSDNRLSPGASTLIILLLSALSWSVVVGAAMALAALL
jgi:hypothetical protein